MIPVPLCRYEMRAEADEPAAPESELEPQRPLRCTSSVITPLRSPTAAMTMHLVGSYGDVDG